MGKIKIGLICLIIMFLFFIGSTIYEIINITKLDKSIMSTRTEYKIMPSGDDFSKDSVKYYFSYNDNEYSCNKYVSPADLHHSYKNETVYFSSSDPNNCSVTYKSNYIIYLIIADVIWGIGIFILARSIKKASHN